MTGRANCVEMVSIFDSNAGVGGVVSIVADLVSSTTFSRTIVKSVVVELDVVSLASVLLVIIDDV